MNKVRLHNYLKKNSVFVFSALVALISNKLLLDEVIDTGCFKYVQKAKYNELRDELDYSSEVGHLVHSALFKAADRLSFERGS